MWIQRILGFAFCLLLQLQLNAQLPDALILIKGKVYEQVGNVIHNAKKIKILIPSFGECETKEDGSFEAKIPHKNLNVQIEVNHPSYRIMKPRNGTVFVEGMAPKDTTINLQIVILREDNDIEHYATIQKKLDDLERQKKVTQRQLNLMNRTLVDTLLHFQRRTEIDQMKMAQLSENLQQSEIETGAARTEYENNIKMIEDSMNSILDKLFIALEERYVLQKDYYDQITYNLNTYSSRIKDMRNYLMRMQDVFQNREFSDHFALLLSDYSNSYESINEEHDNHTVAVGHYWENASLEAQIAELYDLILVDIHREIILPLNDTESAFGLWSAAAQDRAPRIKKAVKIANQTAQELDLLIAKLDHRRDLFLKELIIF